MKPKNNINYYSNISLCFTEHLEFSFIWACDVLHHLSPADYKIFLESAIKKTKILT